MNGTETRNSRIRFIFNPEHDLCLANGDANFAPPLSALRFGHDCSEAIAAVLEPVLPEGQVSAWGWNTALRNRLMKEGIDSRLLPTEERLTDIRMLSHRRTAAEAMEFIKDNISSPEWTESGIPQEIKDAALVLPFLEKNGKAVLKAPWSGSGKGLRWTSADSFNESDAGWCRNTIRNQGSIMAEVRHDKVLDFAMLFKVSDGTKVSFQGYSLFGTSNGAYNSSILLPDCGIQERISEYIPADILEEVRTLLMEFIRIRFSGRYEGFLGADMLVCRKGNSFLLNPAVEINVRMTMGLVARVLHDTICGKYPAGRIIHQAMAGPSEFNHCQGNIDGHGYAVLKVVRADDSDALRRQLSGACAVLSEIRPESRYALAMFRE